MQLVMNDLLYCDSIEFTLPVTPLTRGATHATLQENLEAVFESIGLQLVVYGNMQRQLVRERIIGHDANGAPIEEVREYMKIMVQGK